MTAQGENTLLTYYVGRVDGPRLVDLKLSIVPTEAWTAPKEMRRVQQMAALETARAVRAQVAAQAGGPLSDSTPDLQELRETRADDLDRLR